MADPHDGPPKDYWAPYEPEPPKRPTCGGCFGFAVGFLIVVPLWLAALAIYTIFKGGTAQ